MLFRSNILLQLYREHRQTSKGVYEKQRNLCYGKINRDPYAKRFAARATAAPAPERDRVGPALRAQQADAFRFFERPHLALTAPLLTDDSAVALEEPFRGVFEDDAMPADNREGSSSVHVEQQRLRRQPLGEILSATIETR